MGGETKDTDQIFMDELKQEFMETVAQNLVDMKQLVQENKLEEIARIAHDLKGTAGIFDLDEGTEIARELHHAARNHEVEKTKKLIGKLADYMKKQGIV
jgi:HPt (histidine-containing phosphotransfer) domain-containing protein